MKKFYLLMMALMVAIASQAWTVKFDASKDSRSSGWTAVNVYTFSPETEGGWPGKAMTKGSDGLWTYTGTGNPGMIIFNRAAGSGSAQTGNLVFQDGATYDFSGVIGGQTYDYTVYFKDTNNWGSVYVYAWGAYNDGNVPEYPGLKLTKDEATGLYPWTFTSQSPTAPKGALTNDGFLFNNNNDAQKTPDIDNYVDGAIYLPNGQIYDGTDPDPDKPWNGAYVNILFENNDWTDNGVMLTNDNPVANFTGLNIGTGEFYVKFWSNATGDVEYRYSVKAVPQDEFVVCQTGLTANNTVAGAPDNDACFDVSFNAETLELYISMGEAPAPPALPEQIYVRGDVSDWGTSAEWMLKPAFDLSKPSTDDFGKYVYTAKFNELKGTFKFSEFNDWDAGLNYGAAGGNQTFDADDKTLEAWSMSSENFIVPEGKKFTNATVSFYYDMTEGQPSYVQVTGSLEDDVVSMPEVIYLRGDMNDWGTDIVMTREDGAVEGEYVYSVELDTLTGEFKFGDDSAKWVTFNYGAEGDNNTVVLDTDMNSWKGSSENFIVPEGTTFKNVKVIFTYKGNPSTVRVEQMAEDDPFVPEERTLVAKNVYAYDIVVEGNSDKKQATVSYKLNGLTKSVSIQPVVNGTAVGAAVAGTTNYDNKVVVDYPAYTDGKGLLTFEITATPETTVTDPTLVKDANTPNGAGFYSFWSPTTIAVNTNPETATFGRVLTVENRWHNTPFSNASYHAVGRGAAVYAYDPTMTVVAAEDGKPGFTLGLGANNDTKTQVYGDYQDLVYTTDGRLFLATADLEKYGVYEIDPEDMDATAQPMFEEPTDHNIWAIDMFRNADGTYKVLLAESNDASAGQSNGVTTARIMLYDFDGETYFTNGRRILEDYAFPNGLGMKVRFDADGQGLFVSSHRGDAVESQPHLIHCDIEGGNIDNDYSTVINAGGMGYNRDFTLFARAETAANVAIYSVSNAAAVAEGAKPQMEKLIQFSAGIGNAIMGVAFDYANNIFVSSNSGEKLVQFQLPASIAGESATVATPSSMALEIGTSGVESIVVGENANEAGAVFYNLNGVRVNGDNMPAGVYVKVVGNTATKVVVK